MHFKVTWATELDPQNKHKNYTEILTHQIGIKKENNKCWQECGGKELFRTVGGSVISQASVERSGEGLERWLSV